MPWHLVPKGITLVTLHAVDIRRAREFVPSEYRIVSFLPDRTIGGLFLAEYGPGSDLEYNELIASCATVWYEGRLAPWVTHLYVDSPESVEGGRRMLGVPKHLARFTREAAPETGVRNRITVGEADRLICRIRYGRQLWLWRQRVRLPALHGDVRDPSGSTVVAHGNELRGRFGLTRATVEIPQGSPLAMLGFGKPLLSVCGRDMEAMLGGAPFLPPQTVTRGFRSASPRGRRGNPPPPRRASIPTAGREPVPAR